MNFENLKKWVIGGIIDNLASIVLQTVLTIAIALYAIHEIKVVREDVSKYLDNAAIFINSQSEDISDIVDNMKIISTSLTQISKEKAEQKVSTIKTGLKVFSDKHVDGWITKKDEKEE